MARKLLDSMTLGATVNVFTEVVDKKKFTFTAAVGADKITAIDVCDVSGKIKKFPDLDTFVGAALKVNPSIGTVNFVVDTVGVRTITIPGDAVAAAVKSKANYETAKVKAVSLKTALTAQLAGIASYQTSPNSYYQQFYAEKAAQLAAVTDVLVFIQEKIDEATAIITPPAPAPAPAAD